MDHVNLDERSALNLLWLNLNMYLPSFVACYCRYRVRLTAHHNMYEILRVVTILYNWTNCARRLALDYRNGAVAAGTVPRNTSQTDGTTEGRPLQGGIHHQLAYLQSTITLRVSDPWRPNFPQILEPGGRHSGAS